MVGNAIFVFKKLKKKKIGILTENKSVSYNLSGTFSSRVTQLPPFSCKSSNLYFAFLTVIYRKTFFYLSHFHSSTFFLHSHPLLHLSSLELFICLNSLVDGSQKLKISTRSECASLLAIDFHYGKWCLAIFTQK